MFEPDDLLVALTDANVEFVVRAMKHAAGREQDLADLRELPAPKH